MTDVKELIRSCKNSVAISDGNDNCKFVSLPMFFCDCDDGLLVKISEDESGRPIFSDCHMVTDYLESRDVGLDDHADKLARIVKRFGLIRDDNVFRMKVPTDDLVYAKIYLGYFIQALSLIAYIDL